MIPTVLYCIVSKTAYIMINISILLIIVEHIFIVLIYNMEDINPDILKTVACLIRKRVLKLYSLEDDSELRGSFVTVGGIETGIKFLHY